MTPFEVLCGHTPRQLGVVDPKSATVPDLSVWLSERNLLTQLIQQQLNRAQQQRMKHQSDKNRSEREFQVGDFIFLKLQSDVQSSLVVQGNQKLSFRFYGPYKILT